MEISVKKHNIIFLLFIFTGNLTEMCGAAKFVHDITYKMSREGSFITSCSLVYSIQKAFDNVC